MSITENSLLYFQMNPKEKGNRRITWADPVESSSNENSSLQEMPKMEGQQAVSKSLADCIAQSVEGIVQDACAIVNQEFVITNVSGTRVIQEQISMEMNSLRTNLAEQILNLTLEQPERSILKPSISFSKICDTEDVSIYEFKKESSTDNRQVRFYNYGPDGFMSKSTLEECGDQLCHLAPHMKIYRNMTNREFGELTFTPMVNLIARKFHEQLGKDIYYIPTMEAENRVEFIVEQSSYDFIEEEFIDMLFNRLKRLAINGEFEITNNGHVITTSLLSWIPFDKPGIENGPSDLYTGHFIYGDRVVEECYRKSMAFIDIQERVNTIHYKSPTNDFIKYFEKEYKIKLLSGSSVLTGDFLKTSIRQNPRTLGTFMPLKGTRITLMDRICLAADNDRQVKEIFHVFGKIARFLISNMKTGRDTGILEYEDAPYNTIKYKMRKILEKGGLTWLLIDSFFMLAYGYYRYWWNIPKIAPGHMNNPRDGIRMKDYLGIVTHEKPWETLITPNLHWALTIDTVLFFVIDNYCGANPEYEWEWTEAHTGVRNEKINGKYRFPEKETKWVYSRTEYKKSDPFDEERIPITYPTPFIEKTSQYCVENCQLCTIDREKGKKKVSERKKTYHIQECESKAVTMDEALMKMET